MTELETIVIVGASLGGLSTAEALRQRKFEGRLVLVGAEDHLPYDRPPLSKELLRGDWEAEQTALRKAERYDQLNLDMRLGRRAIELKPDERLVRLDTGERLEYDACVIATGATPRRLRDTANLAGIYTLRTLDDALAIRAELERGPRVAVVGAGFIGLEVAAVCRQRRLDVTVLEAADVPLAHAIGAAMGEVIQAMHRQHGVDLRCGVGVQGVEGTDRVERLRLDDDTTVDAEMVVVGIGVRPETAWLESSGLTLENGIVCDATCRTSAPGVYAVGDVARWYNPLFEETMRVEHWSNAVEQGMHVAMNLLAEPDEAQPFECVPLFWSDQYDVKIQSVGHFGPEDHVEIVDGSEAARQFVALYRRGDRLRGALTFNEPRKIMAYRRLLKNRATWDEALAHARETA